MDSAIQALEEAIQQLLSLGAMLIVIAIAISIIPYILYAAGLSSVARKCGIRHTWYAWLPIARKHLLAEIADVRRAQVRKDTKLEVQFEVFICAFLVCVVLAAKTGKLFFLILSAILIVALAYNQIFCYYYFYRLCDRENATIYFILGMLASPLNTLFVFHCR